VHKAPSNGNGTEHDTRRHERGMKGMEIQSIDEGADSEEEDAPAPMPPVHARCGAEARDVSHNGAAKKGVTYDMYRPPGVETPQKSPSVSPPASAAAKSGGDVSPDGNFGEGARAGAVPMQVPVLPLPRSRPEDLLPPSLSCDDDVRGPSSALLGVGVRRGELAQRSGTSSAAASRVPDGACLPVRACTCVCLHMDARWLVCPLVGGVLRTHALMRLGLLSLLLRWHLRRCLECHARSGQ
jgi:hypothetical protein